MRSLVWLVALTLLFRPQAGFAQAADPGKQAKDAFVEGSAAFNLGQWDKAIASWERGYTIKPDPIFLYNIAQAHRLAENFDRALFFYRNYLRNAPKAGNRAEVEQRIRDLEQAIAAKKNAREAPPIEARDPNTGAKPPIAHTPPPPKPVAQTAPPPKPVAQTPPPPKPVVAQAPASPPDADESNSAPPPRAPPSEIATPRQSENQSIVARHEAPSARRGDLSVSGGVNLWELGPAGGAQPSTNVAVSGGYRVWSSDRLQLRVGAKLGYTYLVDVASTVHFISVLADPMLFVRLWRDKLYFFAELGLGVMIIPSLHDGSAFLPANTSPSGAFAQFELRPALGLEYRVTPMFAIFLAPAVIYSPAPNSRFTDSSILRIDVSLGATLRL